MRSVDQEARGGIRWLLSSIAVLASLTLVVGLMWLSFARETIQNNIVGGIFTGVLVSILLGHGLATVKNRDRSGRRGS